MPSARFRNAVSGTRKFRGNSSRRSSNRAAAATRWTRSSSSAAGSRKSSRCYVSSASLREPLKTKRAPKGAFSGDWRVGVLFLDENFLHPAAAVAGLDLQVAILLLAHEDHLVAL